MNSRIENIATPDAVRGFEETLSGPVSYSGDNKPSLNFRIIQNALVSTNATMTNMKTIMGLLKDEVISLRSDVENMKVAVSSLTSALETKTSTSELLEDLKTEILNIKNLISESAQRKNNEEPAQLVEQLEINTKSTRGRKPANRAKA